MVDSFINEIRASKRDAGIDERSGLARASPTSDVRVGPDHRMTASWPDLRSGYLAVLTRP